MDEFTYLSPAQLKKVKKAKRMCMDKIRYESEWDAESYGKLFNYRNKTNKPYRAYFCPKCLKWHLTTKEKYERKY